MPNTTTSAQTWQLTPHNIAEIDDRIDADNIFAKGYWQFVNGKNTVVGLRIGAGEDRQVAFWGDTVTRHVDERWTVTKAAHDVHDSPTET